MLLYAALADDPITHYVLGAMILAAAIYVFWDIWSCPKKPDTPTVQACAARVNGQPCVSLEITGCCDGPVIFLTIDQAEALREQLGRAIVHHANGAMEC